MKKVKEGIPCNVYDNKSTSNIVVYHPQILEIFEATRRCALKVIEVDNVKFFLLNAEISLLKNIVYSADLVPITNSDFVVKEKEIALHFYTSKKEKYEVLNHLVRAKNVKIADLLKFETSVDISKFPVKTLNSQDLAPFLIPTKLVHKL